MPKYLKTNISFMKSLTLFCIIGLSCAHYIHKVIGEPIQKQAYTNQAINIDIPYGKCFKVQPQLAANANYLKFRPSSLKLTKFQEGKIGSDKNISLIENLRTPQTFTHQNLIIFRNYALTFASPNLILIIKSKPNGDSDTINLDPSQKNSQRFQLHQTYEIKQINQYSRFKIYKYDEFKAMLIIFDNNYYKSDQLSNKKMLLLNQISYEEYRIPNNNFISYLQSTDQGQFFAAQYNNGIGCYSLNQIDKQVQVLANYGSQMFGNKQLYILDVNIKSLASEKIIYALDKFQGVYMINLTQSTKTPQITLILNEPNCNAIDSLKLNHIVLACQLGTTSYIVQAYGIQSNGTIIYERLQPQYHFNYFNDLQINKNYFMVFSHKTLNVYWSSKQNNIPQTVNTQSQLDLPGLQTFYFDISPNQDSFLYTIQSGVMYKYLISEENAKLFLKSNKQLNSKQFKISIFGNCEDLPQQLVSAQEKQNLQGVTCQLQHSITLTITEENSPRKQDFSVSASIIVILIVVFLLIIWICLKKYKGLERQARKILDNYKKKKPRQQLSL